ncbi:MAG: hypothetical protein WCH01_17870 [Methylococcaceae bacterium]
MTHNGGMTLSAALLLILCALLLQAIAALEQAGIYMPWGVSVKGQQHHAFRHAVQLKTVAQTQSITLARRHQKAASYLSKLLECPPSGHPPACWYWQQRSINGINARFRFILPSQFSP